MAKNQDLTGVKIGRLTVIERLPSREWLCYCECGNQYITTTSHLNRKCGVKSCGCYKSELARKNSKKNTENATKQKYQEASKKIKETMKKNNELVENTRISMISDKKIRSDNKSGHTGVAFKDNKWIARIFVSGKEHHLGTFNTKEEAIAAREKGEELYFKPLVDKYKK
ncbi:MULTISPECIES: AP2 domain-containing protein [Listeria]|nr:MULTISPECIES: AP2 domain-containing protein [Listeria]